MKKLIFIIALIFTGSLWAQNFEEPKKDTYEFNGVKVKVGGDFALQFQGLKHSTKAANVKLYDMVSNFNLPTANFDIDAYLAKGVKMHLTTYLSSRHHNEAWVKGGYLQIDNLDFISEGFLSDLMNVTTFKVGQDDINYGDTHFRRSDNANVINNPFVGNYIMDSFNTEIFGEVTVQTPSGLLGVLGVSNGKLNQGVVVNNRYNGDNKISFYGKLGYDKQVDTDLRLRLTGSWYINNGTTTGTYLYGGDRTGSRYYYTLVEDGADDNPFSGRFNPRFSELTALQFAPFVKYKGLEFFGVYEIAKDNSDNKGQYTQLGTELLYRFGKDENLYLGGRYNTVSGKPNDAATEGSVNRLNIGGGWFLTKNILTKVEYVKQTYSDDGWSGTLQGGEFNGVMLEAAISF